jgi:antitoxin VapB
LRRRTESCAAVNAALYHATRIGATGSELYNVAADAYAAQGFADEINKHHQGGAAGYRTRDWVAHPESNDKVRPNQAFAWNPSITGTKTEETAILIDNELEIITATGGFPTISATIGSGEYLSPGILSLSKGASA